MMYPTSLMKVKSRLALASLFVIKISLLLFNTRVMSGFANFIDEWSHCDFCLRNFGVILEYLESSITT